MSQEQKDQQPAPNQDAETASPEKETTTSDASPSVDVSPESVGVTAEELSALREECDRYKAQAEENWNRYLSARAETDNIRKRAERDLANAHKFALERFINELLPVKDSLEMGIAAAAEKHDVQQLQQGAELTLKQFSQVIEKFGISEINPLGEKFNPELHEAISMQASEQAQPNTVLFVVQKGYSLNERLIRPARVVVAQAMQKA